MEDDEDDYKASGDNEDVHSDSDWAPTGRVTSLFSVFGVLMPKEEK
jgi:hypothetical protein